MTFTIIFVLFGEAIQFFRMPGVSLQEFLFTTQWNPLLGNKKHFGVWPLVCGTVLVTGVAMLVAVPLGLITAVYLSEYAPRKVRSIIKPTLEMLAGVPTVVYGFFALTVITPRSSGFTTASTSITCSAPALPWEFSACRRSVHSPKTPCKPCHVVYAKARWASAERVSIRP